MFVIQRNKLIAFLNRILNQDATTLFIKKFQNSFYHKKENLPKLRGFNDLSTFVKTLVDVVAGTGLEPSTFGL